MTLKEEIGEQNQTVKDRKNKEEERKTEPYGGILIASKKELQISNIQLSESVEMISGTINLTHNKKAPCGLFLPAPKEN